LFWQSRLPGVSYLDAAAKTPCPRPPNLRPSGSFFTAFGGRAKIPLRAILDCPQVLMMLQIYPESEEKATTLLLKAALLVQKAPVLNKKAAN